MEITVRIIGQRHPEKLGDKITEFGAMQAVAMAGKLAKLGHTPKKAHHSGLRRARQTAELMMSEFVATYDAPGHEPALNFTQTFERALGADHGRIKAEIAQVAELGGMVSHALEISEYARAGREVVSIGIRRIASLRGEEGAVALATSHSPWIELAAVDPPTMKYEIALGDAVLYEVTVDRSKMGLDGVRITGSRLIRCPIQRDPANPRGWIEIAD